MLNELIKSIKSSKEYSELYRARARVLEDSSQGNMLIDFYSKSKQVMEGNITPAQLEQVMSENTKRFNEIIKYPLINNYYSKLESYNNFMKNIFDNIYKEVGDIMNL